MFRLVVVFLVCALAKSGFGHVAYPAPLLAADSAVVTSSSTQFLGRNYHALASPVVAAPAVAYTAVAPPAAFSSASTVNSFARFAAPLFGATPVIGARYVSPASVAVVPAARVAAAPVAVASPVAAAAPVAYSAPAFHTASFAAPLAYTAASYTVAAPSIAAPALATVPVARATTPVAYNVLPAAHFASSITTPVAVARTNPVAYAASYIPAAGTPVTYNAVLPGAATAGTPVTYNAVLPGATTYGTPITKSAPEPAAPEAPVNPQASSPFDTQASLPDARNPEPAPEGASVYGPPQARSGEQQPQGSISRSDSSPEPLKYTEANGRE